MRILSVCGFPAYWGNALTPNALELDHGPTMGGGEEAAVRTAVGLRGLGHEVLFYWYGQAGVWRGVEFRSLEDPLYPALVNERWDAVLGWSTMRPIEWASPSAKRLFCLQLNDLWTTGDWSRVDCIVSPSASHSEQLAGWGWKGPHAVVHNGLDLDQYEGSSTWSSRPFEVGYWSSPDRGLHHLLRAWPLVTRAIPSAKLNVFYEIDRYLSVARVAIGPYGERARELERLLYVAKLDKSIVFHVAVPRKRLAPIQKRCRVMCYPYDPVNYCEGFCGSVNQGIAAGCLVMTTQKDALPSLYGDAAYWITGPPNNVESLAGQIVDGLKHELPNQTEILRQGVLHAGRYTWERAAREMEAACLGANWVNGRNAS